jgi:hypothetical protein
MVKIGSITHYSELYEVWEMTPNVENFESSLRDSILFPRTLKNFS